MTGKERRDAIVKALHDAGAPVSGPRAGAGCGREPSGCGAGYGAAARRRSRYRRHEPRVRAARVRPTFRSTRLIKVRHTVEEVGDELNTIVDLGGAALKRHGEPPRVRRHHGRPRRAQPARRGALSGRDPFWQELSAHDGDERLHFHRIAAESEEILDEIEEALAAKGYLARCSRMNGTSCRRRARRRQRDPRIGSCDCRLFSYRSGRAGQKSVESGFSASSCPI